MVKELFIGLHGAEDPTKATFPFLMAKGAVDAGHEAAILLMGDAVVLIKDNIVENVHGFALPPLKEIMTGVFSAKVPIYVWGLCAPGRGISDSDLEGKNAKFATASDRVNMVAEYDRVATF